MWSTSHRSTVQLSETGISTVLLARIRKLQWKGGTITVNGEPGARRGASGRPGHAPGREEWAAGRVGSGNRAGGT